VVLQESKLHAVVIDVDLNILSNIAGVYVHAAYISLHRRKLLSHLQLFCCCRVFTAFEKSQGAWRRTWLQQSESSFVGSAGDIIAS